MNDASEARYGILKPKTALYLFLALIALSVAVGVFSEHLFTKNKRNCFMKDGRLYCVEIQWDDMTIREDEVPSVVWASQTGK